jgi:catechol 2,3-dioxygenase-like lactoylglutathione lyase family enzyme
MRIHHIGLVSSSEENADRFYHDLLGLEKTRIFTVPSELSRGFFDLDQSLQAINYSKDDVNLEVFVVAESPVTRPRLDHVGLEVVDRERFLTKCAEMGVLIIERPKGDRVITMIQDFDGNLFEIQEKG